MSYDQLIQIYFERSNALQWYWTVYVVIVGGLLAFSSIRKQRDIVTAALVTVLFCFFAYKNCGAIHDVTDQRLAILQMITQSTPLEAGAPHYALLEATLRPPEYEGVRNFHIASDLLTILAVWAMERRRWRASRIDQPAP